MKVTFNHDVLYGIHENLRCTLWYHLQCSGYYIVDTSTTV